MGEDPDHFTQEAMDEAIEYLLPSHLFYRDARPKLKHPYTIFPIISEEKVIISMQCLLTFSHVSPLTVRTFAPSPKDGLLGLTESL